jgi:hypothetical protein
METDTLAGNGTVPAAQHGGTVKLLPAPQLPVPLSTKAVFIMSVLVQVFDWMRFLSEVASKSMPMIRRLAGPATENRQYLRSLYGRARRRKGR